MIFAECHQLLLEWNNDTNMYAWINSASHQNNSNQNISVITIILSSLSDLLTCQIWCSWQNGSCTCYIYEFPENHKHHVYNIFGRPNSLDVRSLGGKTSYWKLKTWFLSWVLGTYHQVMAFIILATRYVAHLFPWQETHPYNIVVQTKANP